MPDLMRRRRSGWVVLAVCALIASLLAVGVNPATAVEEKADHLASTSACAGEAETDPMFTDVPEGHIFRDAINCLAYHGITVGTGDGTTFSPSRDVTRWQMALFVARAMKAAGVDLGAVVDAGFTDIGDAPAVSRDAINQLAANGVVPEAGTYRPNDPMTRAEMAIFLVGFLDKAAPNVTITEDGVIMLGTGRAAAEADDHFADVRALRWPSVDRAAAALFELGVTTGTNKAAAVVDPARAPLDVNYDPQRTVTRGAMAAFITRALAHTSLAPATTTAPPAPPGGSGPSGGSGRSPTTTTTAPPGPSTTTTAPPSPTTTTTAPPVDATTPSPPSWTYTTQQGSATVVLEWRSSQDPGTGPVTGYRLWWIKHGRDWTSEPQATVDAPVTTYTVADLAPGSYWGRVAAVNRVGVGSAWVFQFDVRNLLVLPGLDWFEATWPNTPGAAKFVVEYKPQSASDWESAPDVPAGRTSKTVTGLDVGSKYSIRVAAFDDSDARLWQFSGSAALGSIVPRDLTLNGFHNDLQVVFGVARHVFDNSPIGGYSVQWRTGDQTYSSDRQENAHPRSRTVFESLIGGLAEDTTYTVRVLPLDKKKRPLGAVESSGRTLPADEFWEKHIVEIYEDNFPWLREAWNEKLSVTVKPTWFSKPDVAAYLLNRHVDLTVNGVTWDNLVEGTGFLLGPVYRQRRVRYPYQLVAVHELAHHFVMDHRVARKPGPVAAGWMFLKTFSKGCDIGEIYPEIVGYVTLQFVQDNPWRYMPASGSGCTGVGYPPSTESQAVVKSAIKGEMPQWLYDTYSTNGTSDGLDLDRLWADVEEALIDRSDSPGVVTPTQIAYGFRDSFGGFCSHAEAVRLLADDETADLNPWVDGGCNTRRPRALEAAPGSNPGEIDIEWQRPFYQALHGPSPNTSCSGNPGRSHTTHRDKQRSTPQILALLHHKRPDNRQPIQYSHSSLKSRRPDRLHRRRRTHTNRRDDRHRVIDQPRVPVGAQNIVVRADQA